MNFHQPKKDFVNLENKILKLINLRIFDINIMKLFITILISLILRIFVSLGGYSGINDPPHFGDFEA